MKHFVFNPDVFNPVFWHVLEALQNPRIRKILVRGGSSAGKTVSITDALAVYQLMTACNVMVLRKYGVDIDDSVKSTFTEMIKRWGVEGLYQVQKRHIYSKGGAHFRYRGLDDEEKIKGIESFQFVHFNELNQFDASEWDEANRRLRGRPNQKLIADWNPVSKAHWTVEELLNDDEGQQGWQDLPLNVERYEQEYGAFTSLTPGYAFKRINRKGDTLWINVTYRDNFWVVGHPACTDPETGEMRVDEAGRLLGFVDHHTLHNFEQMKVKKPNDYRVYGMGEDGLTRTGGEFWKSFEEEKHTRPLAFLPNLPIHVTVDINAHPYVTLSLWQVDGARRHFRQFHELPCRAPHNTARKAAAELARYLRGLGYQNVVFLYGDPSGNAASTNDDLGWSFFQKFIDQLQNVEGFNVANRVQKSAPEVALSGDFINDIYSENLGGWSITVNTACRVSIADYTETKEDANGGVLKQKVKDKQTGITYEKHGHFTDAKRYFIITVLAAEFLNYKNRQRTPRAQSVKA